MRPRRRLCAGCSGVYASTRSPTAGKRTADTPITIASTRRARIMCRSCIRVRVTPGERATASCCDLSGRRPRSSVARPLTHALVTFRPASQTLNLRSIARALIKVGVDCCASSTAEAGANQNRIEGGKVRRTPFRCHGSKELQTHLECTHGSLV